MDAATLAVIAQACRDQERLRFGYTTRGGVESERRVEPHRLVPSGRRWYLVAWDLERDDWRTFRVDRLDAVTHTSWDFDARTLPADDAAAFVAEALAAAPARYEAVVTLHAPFEEVAEGWRHYGGRGLEPLDRRRCTAPHQGRPSRLVGGEHPPHRGGLRGP